MAPSTLSLSPAAIALNRFGLGARPGDSVSGDPRRWLIDQFSQFDVRPAGFAALGNAGEILKTYEVAQLEARRIARQEGAQTPRPPQANPAPDTMMAADTPMAPGKPRAAVKAELKPERKEFRNEVQELYTAGVNARTDSALNTEAPFVERMVHFWSNHFCVSVDNPRVTAFAGAFERDVIRPYVLGRFSDMLLAVERHPAMLIYLNQVQSIGPDSPAAERARAKQRGLNENLAREIMELHTMGVRSGYSQADVTEFARAMTGWSIGGQGGGQDGGGARGALAGAQDEPMAARFRARMATRFGGQGGGQGGGRFGGLQGDPNSFAFRPAQHEPGTRTILGKSYPQSGEDQARAALLDFAQSPATATHVATKIARHFAGDEPPPALVARLAESFIRSGGDLPTLYRTLIASPEAWVATPLKFKTPWEWTISSMRGLGRTQAGQQMAALQTQLGQRVWKPGSPAGWDDIAASWAGPDALLRRVEVAQRMAAPLAEQVDARALAPKLMPASISSATADQLARSESPAGALALLLVSPDFLRR